MKLIKAISIVLGVCIFFLLNNLDKVYCQDKRQEVNVNFPELVFHINTRSAKAKLDIKTISVDNDGDIKHFITRASTPIDALVENGYTVGSMNRVITTSPLNELTNDAYIILQTYRTVIEDIVIAVPYEKLVRGETLCQKLSDEIVEQKGVLGAMTQTIKRTYQGGDLVASEIVNQKVLQAPINEIIILEGPDDSPDQVPQIGYNCSYWETYIDNDVSASDEEKQWLKFTMRWESGCNAESNKSYYKGLFQWDPCLWYEQYSGDSIFDGKAQVRHTLEKLRAGANPAKMWPAVYKKYVATFGELSWLVK